MTRLRTLALIVLTLAAPAPALAQQAYSTWSDPDRPKSDAETRLQGFVDSLNELLDKAEEARAADPRFLRDLRDLARGYDRPWRAAVLDDGFFDGDFTADPAWTVRAGRYWIEKGWGLRSFVDPAVASAPKRLSGEQAAAALFGQILNQAIGAKGDSGTGRTGAGVAAIHTTVPISRAFAVETEFSSWAPKGRFEVALYQGRFDDPARAPGYRLAYSPGGSLELIRVTERGSGVIDVSRSRLDLQDKKSHRIAWTRRPDGEMAVAVDGREVLKSHDRGFRNRFDGIALINGGGDYIVRRITVRGTE